MSTLVISDTHFTKKFEPKRFEALKRLISESERIILNGDFWEGMSTSFGDFLTSEWNKLFPLLKQKETIYIYGNHDHKVLSDNNVYQFCGVAVEQYSLTTPSRTYLFRHGHEFLFPIHGGDLEKRVKRRACRLLSRANIAKSAIIQNVGFRLFGPNILPFFINFISPKTRLRVGSAESLLVCGHTHRPYYNKKHNFIDIGFFDYGWANYLVIDDSGGFKMISKKY